MQLPPAPIELLEWAERTLYFASMGGVAQGLLQYIYEKNGSSLGSSLKLSRAQAQYKRDSLGRISHACLKGVMRFGSISALYFGAELASGIYRAKRDYYNATYGGMVSGAFSGALLTRGNGMFKMGKGVVLGCALGGVIGLPAGVIQDDLIKSLPEESKKERQYRIQQIMTIAAGMGEKVKAFETVSTEDRRDPVGQAIAHLEATMEKNAKALNKCIDNESQQDATDTPRRWTWWR